MRSEAFKEKTLTLKLKINEIYYSIQGESSYMGKPCVFIRLTYCNLRCTYCDTKYAFFEGVDMTLNEIIKQVSSYNCDLVEITGGEPLLQKNVLPLMNILCDLDYEVLLETGGHIDVSAVDKRVKKIMDLKCPSSGEAEKNYWPNIKQLMPTDEVKFVIGNRKDYVWAKKVMEDNKLNERATILFSPIFDKIDYSKLAKWILEDHLDVRMQLQLHKFIWPLNRKGV
jgi:7-carboxy-7-deazaguanine synthase